MQDDVHNIPLIEKNDFRLSLSQYGTKYTKSKFHSNLKKIMA